MYGLLLHRSFYSQPSQGGLHVGGNIGFRVVEHKTRNRDRVRWISWATHRTLDADGRGWAGTSALTAFTLDGTHCVHSKRNDAKDSTSDVIGRYRLSIPVTRTPTEGIYVTMPATNNLRLLDAPDGGCATLGEICVISQRGEFFLVVQNEAISCRQDDGGRVICLGLDGRPQIAEYLASLYANRKESLPPLQPPLPDPPVETFLVNHGRVLWWSASQGMGRILTNKGVVGVHWSNVAPSDRRAYLVPGEPVSYVTLRTPHDSGRKKSYQWEAIGVLHLVVE